MLDGFHGDRHSRRMKTQEHNPRLDTQAAEQLWSRMGHLVFASNSSRSRYPYFLKNYAKWRNKFVRTPSFRSVVNPYLTRSRLQAHARR